MRYKDRIVELVRNYLLMNNTSSQVDRKLGGWNYAERKDERNEVIEQSLSDIKSILSLTNDLIDGKVTTDEFIEQAKKKIKG